MFGFFLFLLFVLAVVCVIAAIVVISGYNSLQRMAQYVRESRSNILVSLKKRQELANKLIDIVQGYAGHERLMHLKVSQDAAEASMAAAYQQTNVALAQVGAMAEKFPELKADGTYRQLMGDLQIIEGDLQNKRERYNACCREFNTKRNSIPTVLYAPRFGFSEAPYLDFDAAAELDQVKDFATDDGAAIQKMLSGVGQGALARSREIGARLGQGGGQLLEKGRKLVNDGAAALADARAHKAGDPLPAGERLFWYLDTGNVRGGPVSRGELTRLRAEGKLRDDSLVCAEGDEQWITYSQSLPKPVASMPPMPPMPPPAPEPPVPTDPA